MPEVGDNFCRFSCCDIFMVLWHFQIIYSEKITLNILKLMKKIFTLSLIVCAAVQGGVAQNVAVNADASLPNSSAMLDVKSNSKGLLIPRVALTGITDVTTIASPANSLMVYNTASAG